MVFDKSKFIARFVEEAREHIKTLNDGLLNLERTPGNKETLNAIVRSAHTVKGSSRMLKLMSITKVAHKLEDTLDALRAGKLEHSKAVFNILFKAIDIISDMVEKTAYGEEDIPIDSEFIERLEKAAAGEVVALPPMSAVPAEDTKPPPAETQAVPAAQAGVTIREEPVEKQPPPEKPSPEPEQPEKKDKAKTLETIRIDVGKLDSVVKNVGEMLSHHSQIKQILAELRETERESKRNLDLLSDFDNIDIFYDRQKDAIIKNSFSIYNRLKQLSVDVRDQANLQGLLTDELQEGALGLRMLPLSTVFDTFHRPVRDMASSLEKEVEFVVEGGETELDKKIIEHISDPLIHMMRNSIDHGIEFPKERLRAGKPTKGMIRLSAKHEGGSVLIEIRDDGSGIPIKKVKARALKKGLYDSETLNKMHESEIINIIFHDGFSTSRIITDISGRGAGMGVVKENIIEKLKGSIQIKTKTGKGTLFQIRLPLTLANMRVLLFDVSNITFAVGAHYVDEVLRVPRSELIAVVDKKAIRLREQIIPIENLDLILKLQGNGDYEETDYLLIIIVSMGSERMGLIIDSLIDEDDMVVKSLPSHIKNNQLVSGVAISGKNEIINILHIPEIIKISKEFKGISRPKRAVEKEDKKAISILVVDDSVNTREIEREILQAYGYSVTLALDGIDALEKAKNSTFDLIITDIEMPRLDGFSLTEKLRADETYKYTPIVIVTSREKDEDKRRGIEVGADAYIIKGSFDQSNLIETVESLVS
jgi:chemotaxis protein histidine kinase CheA